MKIEIKQINHNRRFFNSENKKLKKVENLICLKKSNRWSKIFYRTFQKMKIIKFEDILWFFNEQLILNVIFKYKQINCRSGFLFINKKNGSVKAINKKKKVSACPSRFFFLNIFHSVFYSLIVLQFVLFIYHRWNVT